MTVNFPVIQCRDFSLISAPDIVRRLRRQMEVNPEIAVPDLHFRQAEGYDEAHRQRGGQHAQMLADQNG